ncbi:Ig-like domain-containing protein [Pseudomonas stutzeri]|nr:Ig-like domain-containing protein [Stutzerimonas stutzeri]
MNKQLGAVVTAWGLLAGVSGMALADLMAVDPGPYTAATGKFPLWYQDHNDLALELCRSRAVGPSGGYLCTLIPEPGVYDDRQPMVFPSNWPSELFWFLAETSLPNSGINNYSLEVYVAGIEAAFANELPRDGDQQAFARIRIRAAVPNNRTGTYTVTHPYGVETVNVTQGGRRAINLTRDIGVGENFTGALNGAVGPFLSRADGQRLTAVNPDTGETETFIGDPAVPTRVVGGRNDVNYVEISGPAGTIRTELFALSGKLFDRNALPPTPVEVERSTYSRTGSGSRISVFARTPGVPGASVCYRDTLELVPGTTPSPCLVPLTGNGNGYFFASDANPQRLPASLIVTASNPNGTSRPTSLASPLTDLVKIASARYLRDSRTLIIEASSSDEVEIPDLAAVGFGRLNKTGTLQSLTVTDLAQPPARVTVKSAAGGMDSEPVTVVGAVPPPADNLPPVGQPDSASTSPGVAIDIDVLANDSDPDNHLPLKIASVSAPPAGQGTVAIVADKLRYTPPATVENAFTASFGYVAEDSAGARSGPIAVSVAVGASNRPPLANPDSASTSAGVPIDIDVLANDSDPDGNLPLRITAVNGPLAGQGTVAIVADQLRYTPPTTVENAFTAGFSYTLADSLGATATGNVSVAVSPAPPPAATISVTGATVTRGNNNRFSWELSGTTTLTTNNTLTIDVTTTGGTVRLGSATPNRNNGRWSLTVRNSATLVPTPTPSATVTASNGDSVTVPVTSR